MVNESVFGWDSLSHQSQKSVYRTCNHLIKEFNCVVSSLQIRPVYVLLKQENKKYKYFFFYFLRLARPIFFLPKRCLKSLNQIYRYLCIAVSLVVKIKIKDCRKLTIETWSQNLCRMASLNLIFWYSGAEAKYSNFILNLRPHFDSQFGPIFYFCKGL